MNQNDLQVFTDGIIHYFRTLGDKNPVQVGEAYRTDTNNMPASDYTGIIGISGDRQGCIYFTAPKIFLHHLLQEMGETEIFDELLIDMVGEVANTIAGNARSKFGSNFMLSVPVVIAAGRPQHISIPNSANELYVIPVNWKQYGGHLVICLK